MDRDEVERIAESMKTPQVEAIVLRLNRELEFLHGKTEASPEARHRDRVKRRIAEEIIELREHVEIE